jgi:hypothetical protein
MNARRTAIFDTYFWEFRAWYGTDTVSAGVKSIGVGGEGDRPETNGVSAIAIAAADGYGHGGMDRFWFASNRPGTRHGSANPRGIVVPS